MNYSLSLEAIVYHSQQVFTQFSDYCDQISENHFFHQPPGEKWSVAQNVQHLKLSTSTSRIPYTLPKFVLRWVFGKPTRTSYSYEELVRRYLLKLDQGGKASRRYSPRPVSPTFGKKKLVSLWNNASARYLNTLKRKWTDEELDQYLIRHPLLGKITLRELCFFTIYHCFHHLHTIKNM